VCDWALVVGVSLFCWVLVLVEGLWVGVGCYLGWVVCGPMGVCLLV